MPSQEERVKLAEFTITTRADAARIFDATERGAAAAKSSFGSSLKEIQAGETSRVFAIKGPGGIMEQLRFEISWTPTDDGAHTVRLKTGAYLTTQAKVLVFIPVGPKEVPGVKALERFSKFVREDLERRVAA